MNDNNWQQLLDNHHQEYNKIRNELKEVDMLIQQTSAEVERLVQTNARTASKVRQMEAQFDTYPREDIKSTYSKMLQSQQRLFTMRGQLEKLQSDQKNLTRLYEVLGEIMEQATPEESGGSEKPSTEPTSVEALVISTIEAQERERQRLSRQMHDGPAQALTNLVLQAEICERLFDRDPERARTELHELKDSVVKTFQKVRTFIFDLRPMMLDDLGLVPTMKRYIEGLEDAGMTGVTLNLTGKDRRVASHKEVTVFRVVQELIHIAKESSRAASIKVNLHISDEDVQVSVDDNGSGYELDEELTTPDANKLGLSTMRERIEVLGGQITIRSIAGKGTNISFTLPAPEEEI